MNEDERTILIVDDDRDFSTALAAFLRVHGYRTLQAYDGAAGLKLARLERPSLILMDVIMEERTEGFFTVQELRRDPSLDSIPVFVVSSVYAKVPDFRIEPARGWLAHDDFFAKPVDLDQLLAAIRERLEAGATGADTETVISTRG
jgi:CheY-like chemotaxis protein